MEMLKNAIMDLHHNVMEARTKIHKAYAARDECKWFADWQKEMAAGHLGYNTNGSKYIQEHMHKAREEHAHNERNMGMLDVWEHWYHDIIAEMAEVKAMVEAYR